MWCQGKLKVRKTAAVQQTTVNACPLPTSRFVVSYLAMPSTDGQAGEFPPTPITPSVAQHEVQHLRNELSVAQSVNHMNQQQSKFKLPTSVDTLSLTGA